MLTLDDKISHLSRVRMLPCCSPLPGYHSRDLRWIGQVDFVQGGGTVLQQPSSNSVLNVHGLLCCCFSVMPHLDSFNDVFRLGDRISDGSLCCSLPQVKD